jgi:hypothetical protein
MAPNREKMNYGLANAFINARKKLNYPLLHWVTCRSGSSAINDQENIPEVIGWTVVESDGSQHDGFAEIVSTLFSVVLLAKLLLDDL